MIVFIRRSIALACVLAFVFVSCAMAMFEPVAPLCVMDPNNGYHIELNAQILSHMPFGSERLLSLNELFKYLGIQADFLKDRCSAVLSIDGKPQLTFVHEEDDGIINEWLNALPDTIFIGEKESGILAAYDPLGSGEIIPGTGLKGDEYEILLDIKRLLSDMPTLFPKVKQKNEKIRVKIGNFGTAVQRRTIVIPSDMAKQRDQYQNLLAGKCKNNRFKTWLEGISFTGRQTLTQYLDEEENVIRNIYAGNIRYTDGRVHNLNLSWKSVTKEDSALDEIQLKSPAASGNDRDTLTMTVETDSGISPGNKLNCKYDYTCVRGKEKNVYHGNAEIQIMTGEKSFVNGSVCVDRKHNNNKKQGWLLIPEININEEAKEIMGQIKISRTDGEMTPESAMIQFTLQNNAKVVQIPGNINKKIPLEDEQALTEIEPDITKAVTEKLIVPLLLLPEPALKYFNEGIDESQWNQIMKSIQ